LPPDTGVDHRALVDDKEKGVVVFIRPFLVAPIGLFVRNALADILDDARSGRDTAQRKDTASVNCGIANFNERHGSSGSEFHAISRLNRPYSSAYG